MSGKIIQGFFPGEQIPATLGNMMTPPSFRSATPPAQRQQAFLPHTVPLQPRMASPPTPQRAAGLQAQSVAIDPQRLGLQRVGGKSLPTAILAKMEKAFGADFSAVRVYEGPQAARIGAIAFTTGNDIYFAPGRFRPETPQGVQLLGHELTHVLQQRQGRVKAPVGGQTAVVMDHLLEAEADRMGRMAASVAITPATPPKPARPAPGLRSTSFIQRMQDRLKVPNDDDDIGAPLLIEESTDQYRKQVKSISAHRLQRQKSIKFVLENDYIATKFNLDIYEVQALHDYGSPGKDDPSGNVYMGSSMRWGPHGNGWSALASAIEKLPSFTELGLDHLPLFRVERQDSKLFETLKKAGSAYVFHGIRVMNFGQFHIMSTSLIESSHSANASSYSKGLFMYRSGSARFMNNFSIQGMVDGGECLIPAGVISLFTGIQKVYWLGELVDCAILEEVGLIRDLKGKHKLNKGVKAFDDHLALDITSWAQQEDFYEGFDGWNKYSHLTDIKFDLPTK